jgi:phage baseplate assembly protein W
MGKPNEISTSQIDEDSRFVGILLPMSNSGHGYFAPSKTTREAAFTNLKNLVMTIKGERKMQPSFGCDIHYLIFEPNVGEINVLIEASIKDAVKEWLPYIKIEGVKVDSSNADIDNNNVRVSVKYSITMLADSLDELTFISTSGAILAEKDHPEL